MILPGHELWPLSFCLVFRIDHAYIMKMRTQTKASNVLMYEGIGFSFIIALSWIDELSDLPHFFGASQYVPNWRESALETLIVVAVAIPVLILTKRLASRLFYLEGFLRVCAWCKKLDHNGEWIPVGEFFESKFQMATSHGMCVACLEEATAKMKTPDAA